MLNKATAKEINITNIKITRTTDGVLNRNTFTDIYITTRFIYSHLSNVVITMCDSSSIPDCKLNVEGGRFNRIYNSVSLAS